MSQNLPTENIVTAALAEKKFYKNSFQLRCQFGKKNKLAAVTSFTFYSFICAEKDLLRSKIVGFFFLKAKNYKSREVKVIFMHTRNNQRRNYWQLYFLDMIYETAIKRKGCLIHGFIFTAISFANFITLPSLL